MRSIASVLTPPEEEPATFRQTAIVDIGSNSVRLVVYAGPQRNPAIIFNEKVMAGLGAELAETGRISEDAFERGLAALQRFRAIVADMHPDEVIAVATAAVRDAENGPAFAEAACDKGFDIQVISGAEEAQIAAMGVLSAIPGADGVVADLGGGSLELARVQYGEVKGRISTPLGALRARELAQSGRLAKALNHHLQGQYWAQEARGLPLYLVGGSWRALARLEMYRTGEDLAVLHNHEVPRSSIGTLAQMISTMGRDELKAVPRMATARIDTLKPAIGILGALDEVFAPPRLILSAYGIREGLLYRAMPEHVRRRDPLLEATGFFGRNQSRFDQNGDVLKRWMRPIADHFGSSDLRIVHAACNLADVSWQATPDFRAERAVEIALHGNWVGIDARERGLLALALHTSFGGAGIPDEIARLLDKGDIHMATAWGLGMRLGQRLGGGTDNVLGLSRLVIANGCLSLRLDAPVCRLVGESVDRRMKKLAQQLDLEWKVECLD